METIKINEENLQKHLREFISRYETFKELSNVIDGLMYNWLLDFFNNDANVANGDDVECLIVIRWLRDFFIDINSEDGSKSPTLASFGK